MSSENTLRRRRARGSAQDRIAIHLQIDAVAYNRITAVADGIGISKGRALELLLHAADIDERGRPAGYDGPLMLDLNEELPLDSTA